MLVIWGIRGLIRGEYIGGSMDKDREEATMKIAGNEKYEEKESLEEIEEDQEHGGDA